MVLNEHVAQRQRILDAPVWTVTVAAIAGRGPRIALLDEVCADRRVRNENIRSLAAVPVGEDHQTPVPVGGDLDAVCATGREARLRARPRQRVERRIAHGPEWG